MASEQDTPVSDSAMERLSVNHTGQWPKLVELETALDLEREAKAWRERFGRNQGVGPARAAAVCAAEGWPQYADVGVAKEVEREVNRWRNEFPQHVYRRQDDCISLKFSTQS
jgi:hypothetical protein